LSRGPYLSPAAGDICLRDGVGYQDLAGNCRLAFGSVFIERQGFPNPESQRRDLRSLYSPKAERALRVLLAEPRRPWRMQALAEEARVSLGQAANVKKLLADREWIEVTPEGFLLREPEALLREWAGQYRQRSEIHECFSLLPVSEIERRLMELSAAQRVRAALTEFSAAGCLAPFVRYQRATAYWEGDRDSVVRSLELKRVPSGSNVRLLAPYDEGVFYGGMIIDGLPIVSPHQAYLDLQRAGLRSEEAAEELLARVLRRRWREGTRAAMRPRKPVARR
jgi:hypothetical protein